MAALDLNDQRSWNRLLLILTGLYAAMGLVGNIMCERMSESSPVIVELVGIGFILFWAVVFLAVSCVGLARKLMTVEALGFVINRRMWISGTLTLLWALKVISEHTGGMWSYDPSLLMTICGVTLEEVVFRGILISTLLSTVRPKDRWGVAGLIFAAAALWAVCHIPTKNAAELFGVFTGGVFFGCVYYYTRSLLFPIFVHVAVNTAKSSGLLGGAIAIVCYFIVAGSLRFMLRSKETVEVQAT